MLTRHALGQRPHLVVTAENKHARFLLPDGPNLFQTLIAPACPELSTEVRHPTRRGRRVTNQALINPYAGESPFVTFGRASRNRPELETLERRADVLFALDVDLYSLQRKLSRFHFAIQYDGSSDGGSYVLQLFGGNLPYLHSGADEPMLLLNHPSVPTRSEMRRILREHPESVAYRLQDGDLLEIFPSVVNGAVPELGRHDPWKEVEMLRARMPSDHASVRFRFEYR